LSCLPYQEAADILEIPKGTLISRLARARRLIYEAMYLLMRRVFDDLGYRRYEWKCDSLNSPSRAAAERYGFRFKGLFRQAVIYKERNGEVTFVPSMLRWSVEEMKPGARLTEPSVARVRRSTSRCWLAGSTVKTFSQLIFEDEEMLE
jgi:hypothetical protein